MLRCAALQIQPLLEEPVGMALYEWRDGQIGNVAVQGGTHQPAGCRTLPRLPAPRCWRREAACICCVFPLGYKEAEEFWQAPALQLELGCAAGGLCGAYLYIVCCGCALGSRRAAGRGRAG